MRSWFFLIMLVATIALIPLSFADFSRRHDLPGSAFFIAMDIALLGACLSVGGFFLLGAHGGVMLFGIVGIPALGLGYLALGGAQATAIVSGLRRQGFDRWPAVLVALLLAYVPVIGGAAAVRGAMAGWGWAAARGLVRFFGPLVVMAAPLFSE